MNCSCIYCRKEFSIKGIFCHVDRAHLGKTHYSSGNNGKYDDIRNLAKNKNEQLKSSYNKNPKLCLLCCKPIEFERRNNKFCSHTCSAVSSNLKRKESGWKHSKEYRIKLSEKMSGKTYVEPIVVTSVCTCGKEFTYTKLYTKKERKYCSISCATKFSRYTMLRKEISRKNKTDFQNYRADCQFKFNLKQFPDEFDFSLIEQFGWYKPKNRGNNLSGVSRDHMLSIKYGFENKIDPKLISHPANCKLIKHNENSSKHVKCSISLDELIIKIEEWDKKY